jgi:hypothetical protein
MKAFFSTPFMTMDDGLSFKAWRKVWIFFLVSAIITTATFSVSLLWDKFHLQEPSEKDTAAETGEKVVLMEDRQFLEPPIAAEPDSTEILLDSLRAQIE